jgi:hypothetical protein
LGKLAPKQDRATGLTEKLFCVALVKLAPSTTGVPRKV